jgi:uncharacterized protein (TIGR02722 family)
MKPINRFAIVCTVVCTSLLVITSCATTRNVDTAVETHYDASYDFSDKAKIVDRLSSSLVDYAAGTTSKPVLISYGIGNETSEHINTGGISDDIRLALIQSGQYQLLNESQRYNIQDESSYQQSGTVPPSQRIAQGRQLGADYILAGTLRSIVKKPPRSIRLVKKKLVYYSLNLELTDTESGAIAWADKVELAREQSRPIIGW